jgi:type IX secretion system PorP/SprF family membrane protein
METILATRYTRAKWLTILFIVIAIAFTGRARAQQLPLYSQYTMNSFLLNPASAAVEGYSMFSLTAREQWLGLPMSPKTHALTFQKRLGTSKKYRPKRRRANIFNFGRRRGGRRNTNNVAIGGYIFNDKNGIIDRTGLQFSYAYHIPLDEGQLSMGMSVTGFQFRIDEDKMVLYDEYDALLSGSDKTLYIPDANAGIYYVNRYMYAGLSASDLFESSLKLGDTRSNQYKLERHYYLMGGYKYTQRRWDYLIEPNAMIKFSEAGALQVDVGSKVYYRDYYWGGLSYRTGAGAGAIIIYGGVKVDNFLFSYAFDLTMSSVMKHTFGSHEFMVSYKFGDNARRYRWLRRY